MKMKFYRCEHCGNIIAIVAESGVPVYCCGQPMRRLIANTTDGAAEKHIPVYEVKNNIVHVRVGDLDHPMTKDHFIEWIALQTTRGNQRKYLVPGDKPEVFFALSEGGEVTAVYAYCNIHGLWIAEA